MEKKQIFSIRKTTMGVGSLLLATTLTFGGGEILPGVDGPAHVQAAEKEANADLVKPRESFKIGNSEFKVINFSMKESGTESYTNTSMEIEVKNPPRGQQIQFLKFFPFENLDTGKQELLAHQFEYTETKDLHGTTDKEQRVKVGTQRGSVIEFDKNLDKNIDSITFKISDTQPLMNNLVVVNSTEAGPGSLGAGVGFYALINGEETPILLAYDKDFKHSNVIGTKATHKGLLTGSYNVFPRHMVAGEAVDGVKGSAAFDITYVYGKDFLMDKDNVNFSKKGDSITVDYFIEDNTVKDDFHFNDKVTADDFKVTSRGFTHKSLDGGTQNNVYYQDEQDEIGDISDKFDIEFVEKSKDGFKVKFTLKEDLDPNLSRNETYNFELSKGLYFKDVIRELEQDNPKVLERDSGNPNIYKVKSNDLTPAIRVHSGQNDYEQGSYTLDFRTGGTSIEALIKATEGKPVPFDFKTIYEADGSLEFNQKFTQQEGKEGLKNNKTNEIIEEAVDKIVHVGNVEKTTEEIPFETERRLNADLEPGSEDKVIQEGEVGEKEIIKTYEVNKETGELSNPKEDVKITDPVNKIIEYAPTEGEIKTVYKGSSELEYGEHGNIKEGTPDIIGDDGEVITPGESKVVHVGNVEKSTKEILYKTIRRPNNDLNPGETKTVQPGEKGLEETVTTYEVNESTGELSNPDSKTTRVKEPVDEIIEYGPSTGEIEIEYEGSPDVEFGKDKEIKKGQPERKDEDGNIVQKAEKGLIHIGNVETITEEIPFGIERRLNPDLEPGSEDKVIQEGEIGQKEIKRTYEVDSKTGELGKYTEEESVIKEAKNKIVEYAPSAGEITTEYKGSPDVEFKKQEPGDEGTPPKVGDDGEIIDEGSNKIIYVGNVEKITEEIPFETERRENKDLKPGEEKVAQEGKVGQKEITRTYEVNKETGELGDFEESVNTTDPVTEIVEYGPKSETPAPAPCDCEALKAQVDEKVKELNNLIDKLKEDEGKNADAIRDLEERVTTLEESYKTIEKLANDNKTKISELEQAIDTLEGNIKDADERIDQVEKDLNERINGLDKTIEKVTDELNKEKQRVTDLTNELKELKDQHNKDKQEIQTEIENINKELKTAKDNISTLESELNNLKDLTDEQQKEIDGLKENLNDLNSDIDTILELLVEIESNHVDDVDTLINLLVELEGDIKDADKRISQVEKDLNERVDGLDKTIGQVTDDLNKEKQRVTDLTNDLKELKKQHNKDKQEIQTEIENINKELTTAKDNISTLESELNNLKDLTNEQQKEIDGLKENLKDLNSDIDTILELLVEIESNHADDVDTLINLLVELEEKLNGYSNDSKDVQDKQQQEIKELQEAIKQYKENQSATDEAIKELKAQLEALKNKGETHVNININNENKDVTDKDSGKENENKEEKPKDESKTPETDDKSEDKDLGEDNSDENSDDKSPGDVNNTDKDITDKDSNDNLDDKDSDNKTDGDADNSADKSEGEANDSNVNLTPDNKDNDSNKVENNNSTDDINKDGINKSGVLPNTGAPIAVGGIGVLLATALGALGFRRFKNKDEE